MKKGVSPSVVQLVEQSMHEAWRVGRDEGRREVVEAATQAILEARFGGWPQWLEAIVRYTADDDLPKLVVVAAICDDLEFLYQWAMDQLIERSGPPHRRSPRASGVRRSRKKPATEGKPGLEGPSSPAALRIDTAD